MPVLVGQMEQRLDGFGQIHRGGGFAGRRVDLAVAYAAFAWEAVRELDAPSDGLRCA